MSFRSSPFVRRHRRRVAMAATLVGLTAIATGSVVVRAPESAGAAGSSGYWLVGTDGGVFSYGNAAFYGSTGNIKLNQPIVGLTPTPSGKGYWMVASDGGIFAFGEAAFHGSMGGKPLNKPIVAMASSRSGRGYWMVASDGGIFAFGDAAFAGSMGGTKLNKPIVDMAVSPSGRGYTMAASDGGIFAFGGAGFYGSTGTMDLVQRIHAMAATPTGKGYWMVAGDGGIFAFGDAGFFGSPAAKDEAEKRVIDIVATGSGKGYYVTTSSGQVLGYGDGKYFGDADKVKLNNRIAAMAAVGANEPPIAVDDVLNVDEDGVGSIDLLANDRDPEGGPLSIRSTSAGLRGTVTMAGGSATYKPLPDANGDDSFTYLLVDDRGDTATGRVTVSIKAIDDKPKAVDDEITILEDQTVALNVLVNDSGLGDGVKSLEVSSGPKHGKATANPDRSISYVPAKDDTDAVELQYKVTDIDGDTDTARVKVRITPVNDIPVAVDDVISTRAGKTVSIDVAKNDDSPDGFHYLKFAGPDGNPIDSNEIMTAGGGKAKRSSGKIVYEPAKGDLYNDTFSYVIEDDDGDISNVASVRIAVGANAAPKIDENGGLIRVPEGQASRGDLSEKIGGRQLASDPDGDPLTYILKSNSEHVELKSDGQFTYTPTTPGGTEDAFTFTVSDGNSESNVGTVKVIIEAPEPPQASGYAVPVLGLPALLALAGRRFRRRR